METFGQVTCTLCKPVRSGRIDGDLRSGYMHSLQTGSIMNNDVGTIMNMDPGTIKNS